MAAALRRPRARQAATAGLLVAALGAAAGCEHPIPVVTPHLEAADVVLRDTSGAELARTVDNRSWSGEGPALTAGDGMELVVRFLDFQGDELELDGRSDLQVRLEFEDPAAGFWEPLSPGGRLLSLAPGPQRLRVVVRHLDHVDFVSPWLEVTVAEPTS
jgi:hypothetical protein